MNTTIINLILYIPFVAVLLVVAPIYLTSGYKRGLWRALVSIGATVVSIIASVFLAKMVGWLVAIPVSEIIPKDSFDSYGIFKDLAFMFARGVIQVVLTFAFFVLFLIILLIIAKKICNKIKVQKLDTDKKSFKWAGLGVRLVDSIIVSIMVALPVYGVMATYVPPLASLQTMSASEDSKIVEVLDTVVRHPIVESYKVGPSAWIFEGLSDFGVNGENINPAKISNVMYGVASRFESVMTGDDASRIEAISELGRYIRDNVIGESWSYDIVSAVSKELQKQVDTLEDEELKYEAERFMPLLDLTRSEYEDNGYALLDFMLYAFDEVFVDFLQTRDESLFTEEYYTKLGDLINHSEHALMLKEIILEECAITMHRSYLYAENPFDYGTDGEYYYNEVYLEAHDEYSENITSEAKRLAKEYMAKYYDGEKVAKANRVREAKAFSTLFFGSSIYSTFEGFSMYPGFGPESVKDLLSPKIILSEYQYFEFYDEIAEEYEKHPELHNILIKRLSELDEASILYDSNLEDYASCISSILLFTQFEDLDLFVNFYDGDILKYVVENLGEEYFINSKMQKGKEAYVILCKYAEVMQEKTNQENDFVYSYTSSGDFKSFYYLICAAEDPTLWPSRVEDALDGVFTETTRSALSDTDLAAVLSKIVSERGNNPFGVNSKLTYNQKQAFRNLVDMLYGQIKIDMNDFASLDKETYDRIMVDAEIYNAAIKNNCDAIKNFFEVY